MTFTPNIPQSGQSLGQTQQNIQNNFTNYATLVAVNHFGPNTGNAGKHTFAEFVTQAQSPATAAGEVANYCRTVSGTPQLFLQKASQLAGASDIQMSRVDFGASGVARGFSFLPGGVLVQWGRYNFAGSATSLTDSYSQTFTAAVFSFVATAVGGNGAANALSYMAPVSNLAQFTVQRAAGGLSNQAFFIIAIGN